MGVEGYDDRRGEVIAELALADCGKCSELAKLFSNARSRELYARVQTQSKNSSGGT